MRQNLEFLLWETRRPCRLQSRSIR
jgi:hypothetical protein